MYAQIFGYLVLLLACLAAIYAALEYHARYARLNITDMREVLRPIDLRAVWLLLQPTTEDIIRPLFSKESFEIAQRRDLFKLREYLLRMSHNAFVLILLANTQLSIELEKCVGIDDTEKFIELARNLQVAAVDFYIYSLLSLARIRFWSLVRIPRWMPFPSPRIADIGETLGLNCLPTYARLKEAAGELFAAIDPEFYDELMAYL
ncbi:MAG TPA: hypothetical protein VKZ53_27835 [Candidatus Angelobacter sp.]|nr:hypothetical protein [Candidatus Angelobacter sp.]